MNKKQEILDCIKTLNLTQEQANRLADVLAVGGEGGSNKSVKMFIQYQESEFTTFKLNDKEIPFTEGNEGDIGTVWYINEQDFNYIENNIKGCSELQIEMLSNDFLINRIYGIKVLYSLSEYTKHYVLEGAYGDGSTIPLLMLYKNNHTYYFIVMG